MKKNMTVLAILALATAATATVAEAKCGPSNNGTYSYNAYKARPYRPKTTAASKRNADQPTAGTEVTIAGLWHTEFLDGGMVVDEGFDLWNSDGTEILNDTTSPLSGNVCLGVWAKTGTFTYTLKHPSWIYDDAGVNLVGIAYLNEKITLDASGDAYTGDISIDAFDLDGNPLSHFDAKIAATRMKAIDPPK